MPWPPARNTARDDEMVRLYLSGVSMPKIAARMDLTVTTVSCAIHRRGVRLAPEERRRRRCADLERVRADRDLEAKRIVSVRRARTVWPDCPPERRDEYLALRRKGYTAAEARALIEADMARERS